MFINLTLRPLRQNLSHHNDRLYSRPMPTRQNITRRCVKKIAMRLHYYNYAGRECYPCRTRCVSRNMSKSFTAYRIARPMRIYAGPVPRIREMRSHIRDMPIYRAVSASLSICNGFFPTVCSIIHDFLSNKIVIGFDRSV